MNYRRLFNIMLAAVVAVIAVGVSSCRSSKGAAQVGDDRVPAGAAVEAGASLATRYDALTGSWKSWNDMEVGMKLQLTSPSKLNAAGKAWMKRGEWIYISIRMIGFEVATVWIDSDSIVAVDKFHKKYLSEPTAQLLAGASVTLEDIQDVLLGRAFLAGKGTATPQLRKSFDFEEAENGWYLLPREQPESYTYGFLASNTANALRGTVVEVKNYGAVTANYDDIFESRGCGWFAQTVKVENSRGKRIAATLRWDLNGAKFNTGMTKQCRIPDGCERIPASAIAGLLKSM